MWKKTKSMKILLFMRVHFFFVNFYYTRMHSSRMRTVRNSSRLRGVSAPGGVCSGGCLHGGVSAPGGGISACTEADPPMDRMTGVKTLPCRNFVSDGNQDNCDLFPGKSKVSNIYPQWG